MAGLVQKFKNMWNPPDDEYDYDYDYDETAQEEEKPLEHETISEPRDSIRRAPYGGAQSGEYGKEYLSPYLGFPQWRGLCSEWKD